MKKLKPLVKKILPQKIITLIRGTYVALLTPMYWSYRTGHFKSAFKNKSVNQQGIAVPWYTYPCLDLLEQKDFSEKNILEFGGGQSTVWWSKKAKKVITLEGSREWLSTLEPLVSDNVELHLVNTSDVRSSVSSITSFLDGKHKGLLFDVIIIDGLSRDEMSEIAISRLSDDGVIIYDNSERSGDYIGDCYEYFKDKSYNRADYFGYSASATSPTCTSLLFKSNSFIFNSKHKVC